MNFCTFYISIVFSILAIASITNILNYTVD